MSDAFVNLLLQAGKAGSKTPGCAGGGLQQFVLMGLMFLVFYFLLIRPQQKKAREHREMLSNLKRGDRIITNGGLVGRISGITEKYVTLEIAEKVRVRALRSHVLGKVGDEGEPESK